MYALEPLKPIMSVNFPNDRDYTINALIEELSLAERHCRDQSYPLCSCLSEKHTFLIAGLASEGMGFSESPEEREFMKNLMVRARVIKDDIKKGKIKTEEDYDAVRAWTREMRHRLDQRNWKGGYEKYEYASQFLDFVEVVSQIHSLTGDIPTFEDKQVDEILTHLSEKHGIPKPRYRFIDKCNPLKEAWMVGADIIERDGEGNIKRIPLTDMDEIVLCRGGASPYAISHEFCHYKDRVKTGTTSEVSATECALRETENKTQVKKNLYTLSIKKDSGGSMAKTLEKLTARIGDALPLVGGVIVGEAIDASGMIDNTIAPFAGTWTGLVKGIIGSAIVGVGLGMKKGLGADIVLGAGLPIAASGFTQQFFPGGIIPPPAAALPAPTAVTPTQLTSYARPTGLRYGHPTLNVPMIPPRPGILSYSTIPQALAPKYMLGTR